MAHSKTKIPATSGGISIPAKKITQLFKFLFGKSFYFQELLSKI